MKITTKNSGDDPRWWDRIPITVLGVVAMVVLAGVAAAGLFLGNRGQAAQDESTSTQQQLDDAEGKVATGVQLAGETLKFCMDPDAVQAVQDLGYDHICRLAVVVQTQGEPGKPGERGPGPTQEQINTAVDEYFRAHPLPAGKAPTAAQVATAVGEYLQKNPPAPGRPPTPEEVGVATANYLALHTEDFKGEKGDKGEAGERGPAPTYDDVLAAVNAYCEQGNRCQGPKGDQGAQGIGITGTDLHRDEQGVCTLYINREDPATGVVVQDQHQVNDEMCPPTPLIPPIGGGG